MPTYKKQRIKERLLAFLAEQLRLIEDERILFLTVTSLELTPDMKRAKVFWTIPGQEQSVFPSDAKIKEVGQVLADYRPSLKRSIAKGLSLRFVPELVFQYDAADLNAHKIDLLLAEKN